MIWICRECENECPCRLEVRDPELEQGDGPEMCPWGNDNPVWYPEGFNCFDSDSNCL
jgi:hypothetical protein